MLSIKVKIDRTKLQSIYEQYKLIAQTFEPDDSHEQLLFAGIIRQTKEFQKILLRNHDNFTLSMDEVDCLMFYQLWNEKIDVRGLNIWTQVCLQKISDAIHKKSVEPAGKSNTIIID